MMLPLAATETMQWVVYAIGALTIVFVVMRPAFRKKDPLSNSGPKLGLAQQRNVERDMSNLLVELSEMARQITGQLDTRSAKLEALMQDADKKIAELKKLSSSSSHRTERHTESVITRPITQNITLPGNDPRYTAIYDLADAGRSVQEIAQELDRPRGEVELILALRVPSAT